MTVLIVFIVLILVPAAAAFLSKTSLSSRAIIPPGFGVGVAVVYQQRGISAQPVANAHEVRPSERGEFYYYSLINYLRVADVLDDGRIIAIAGDNKRICLWPNDSQLRKARLLERLLYRWRFPHI